MNYYYFSQVQSGYGCADYGTTDAYNSCTTSQSGGGSAGGGSVGGNLLNTGSPAMLAVSLGIIIIAVVLFVKFLPRKKK